MVRTLQLGMGWFAESPGGLNRVYSELVSRLPSAGVGVRGFVMATSRVDGAMAGRIEAVCAPGAPLALRWWRMRRRVSEALLGDARAVVATHFALYALPILDLLGRHPLVVHFHGPWALEARHEGGGRVSTAAKAALERAVYQRGRAFIVLSRAFGRVLQHTYGVDERRVHVVPAGVDVDRFSPTASRHQAREALGWPTDRPVVLSVRRLTRRMGLEDLIAAAAIVRRQAPDVLVLIAGTGALASELNARISASGLDRQVQLLGLIPEELLPLAYRAADLTVVPTVALEGFGLVVPESLAAGTPTLVTPESGLPETVEGLSSDLVVPERGAPGLADGILRALTGRLPLPSPDACRAFAHARYDWAIIAQRVAAVYREVSG
jgi:glycosyltransferase involved in cell wall biosynthesis